MTATKLLLVEDDPIMLSLLHKLLTFEGYEIIPMDRFLDLDEILTCIHEEKPALILLDVHLERFDGFDILKQLRSFNEGKSIRVLMSSGMDLSERSKAEGADGFILKPYMPDDLIKTIQNTLDANHPTDRE